MLSYNAGTEIIAVIWYSFILFAICLIPSQYAILAPLDIGYRKPTVHSNVWCKGKNESKVSLSSKFKTFAISIRFDAIFLCDSITAFDIAVVPDVNNMKPIASLFILASKNFLFPFSINSLPAFTSSFCEYTPFSLFSKSIDI